MWRRASWIVWATGGSSSIWATGSCRRRHRSTSPPFAASCMTGGGKRVAKRRVAVVLFNLGGPDAPAAVRPFLYNLFSDPAIIALPSPLRQLVAWLVARRRAPIARAIYAQIGGGSPLLPNT